MAFVTPEKGNLIVKDEQGRRYVVKPFAFFGQGYKTIPLNEALAHVISGHYELNVVPPTIIDSPNVSLGPTGLALKGSVQIFIDGPLSTLHNFKGEINPDDAAKILLLDTIICNSDRKAENVLVTPTGNLIAIDHGFSLGFQTDTEANKREGDKDFDVHPYSLDSANLNIHRRILEAVANSDGRTLERTMAQIQARDFLFEYEEYGYDENVGKELGAILTFRVKYLPTLIWRQFK